MTTPLERRYRRLLAAYPREHRRVYEDEMVGVLMAGRRPGQRRPGPAEATDLLWSGLRARFDRARPGPRAAAWRDAGAVVGLLGAAVLAAVPAFRLISGLAFLSDGDPMRAYGVDGLLLLDVAVRFVAWLAVVTAVVAGARRVAAGLGVVAAATETVALAGWPAQLPDRLVDMSWLPVLTTLVVGSLWLAVRGRTAVAVMSRRGVALGAAGAVLVVAGRYATYSWWRSDDLTGSLRLGDAVLPLAIQVLLVAMITLCWVLRMLPPSDRRRTVVAAVPVLLMPVVTNVVDTPGAVGGLAVGQAVLLVAVPVLALFWSVMAVRRWEQRPAG